LVIRGDRTEMCDIATVTDSEPDCGLSQTVYRSLGVMMMRPQGRLFRARWVALMRAISVSMRAICVSASSRADTLSSQ
jgi:hypothetical protein